MCFLNLCFCLIYFGISLASCQGLHSGFWGFFVLLLVPPTPPLPTVLSPWPSEDISWSHDQAWAAKGNGPGLTLDVT